MIVKQAQIIKSRNPLKRYKVILITKDGKKIIRLNTVGSFFRRKDAEKQLNLLQYLMSETEKQLKILDKTYMISV